MMMKRIGRDRGGATAMEFGLMGLVFMSVTFGIFDLGRYAMTAHGLRTLASEAARTTIIGCYEQHEVYKRTLSCPSDPFTASQKRSIAPMLFLGGLTPTVSVVAGGTTITVTASAPGFSMFMPWWGTTLNNPSSTVTIPL